jgi:magnesium-protoporphyrin O-methyltransferase
MSCCNHKLYDNAFDAKFAQSDLTEYLTTGLKKSSRPFFESLKALPLEGHTLLDIGGGIGAVTFELFKQGIRSSTHVDISGAYVQTFRSEAARHGLTGKIQSFHGDFLELHEQTQAASLVILDKVICCYPDYEALVKKSVAKARCWYVYSIPRDLWWVRFRLWVDDMIDRLKGRYLPVYYHPVKGIEDIIAANGFQKKEVRLKGWWRVAVFEKKPE